jgi:transketolase
MQKSSLTTDRAELTQIAHALRLDVLEMLHLAGSGHIGGAFGMADIFTALYFSFLRTNPENPSDPCRDYCLLSNGHICPIYYATLARRGFFPIEEMQKLRKIDSLLQGHPKLGIPWVENSSGPLGHGLSQAVWIALALKMGTSPLTPLPRGRGEGDGDVGVRCRQRVVCCMSDGEHQEGQTWEAIMSAKKWNLDNLIAIVDVNNLQIEGTTDEVMPLGDLAAKYRSFGWHVREIDGHDFIQILDALAWADACDGPAVILAHTILGKWVSFMENDWHYHDWPAKAGDYEKARAELTI